VSTRDQDLNLIICHRITKIEKQKYSTYEPKIMKNFENSFFTFSDLAVLVYVCPSYKLTVK